MLAVFLIISPLGNITFAGTSEDTPWVYDTARVVSNSGVSGQYGDYQDSYVVDLPQGTNGLTPNVQLSYSSQSSGYGSSVGYGWSLSMPAITRLNKNGVDQIYTKSDFHSSYDGELTEVDVDEFIPKVQTGGFRTYIKGNDNWTTYSPDGVRHVFGSSTDSRKRAHSTSTDIYAWYLDEVQDTNGNKITYGYTGNEGNVYPAQIFYGYDSQNSNAYEVLFVYASTTNDYVSYETGFAVVNDRVLESIEVYFDGALITKYELEYENPAGSSINLLSSVQKIGYDQNGVTTSRSPHIFEYGQESISWTNDAGIASTTPSHLYLQVSDTGQNYTQYSRDMLVDMNGDGLTDWVEGSTVYLNTGDGWEASSSWSALPVSNIHFENRLVDVNGDLLPDIVTSKKESWDPYYSEDDVYTKTVRLNQGDGTWEVDSELANHIPGDFYWQYHNYPSGITYYNRDVFFVDMNGDGLNDWLYDGYVYLNNGAGWATTSTWARLQSTGEPFDAKWRLSDINSDGLPDLIKSDTVMYDPQFNNYNNVYTNQVWMNLGNGNWERNSDWEATIPSDFNSRFYIQYWNYPGGITNYQNRVYLADVNGDGLDDWLYTDKALLNTGYGWASSTVTLPVSTEDLTKGYRLVDIDGDLQLDFVRHFYKYFFGTVTHTKEALINNSQKQWLLSTTTDEYGGITSITYGVTTAKVNGQLLNPSNPVVQYVVSEIAKDPLIGESVITEFAYTGGGLYFASTTPFDRKFAGFESVTSETSLGKTKVYYHQGNGNATSSYESADIYAKIGMPYRTEIYDLSDNLYKAATVLYDVQSLATSSDFVKKTDEVVLQYDGDGDHRDNATSFTYDSGTGLLASKTEYGEVSASPNASYSDTGSDKRTTEYEYASSGTNNILGLLSKETLKDNSGTKVRESNYYYDNQPLESVVTGNRTKQEDWVEGSTYIDKQWTYNSLGQKLSETDPRGKTQLYEYDSFDLFVSSTTNAVGHNIQYEYDYSSGKVATTTDASGELYVTVFDGLDRPVEIIAPDPQTGNQVTQKTYSYVDTPGSAYAEGVSHLTSSLTSTKYSYIDGFNRVIQERDEAEDSNQFAVKDYIYGDNRLLYKESLPYFGTGSGRTSPTTNADLLSVYTYDPLSRITSVETTVGTTGRSYDQWKETITDTANNDKTLEYDAFGRLVQVTEKEGANSYDTTYNWNARGDLIKITDAEDNVRNLAYDGLGRRISLEDLHDVSDGTFGTWLFDYDDAGNVSSTTDPKGQVVNYSHDDINRLLTENYLGTGYTDVVYSYDSCTNGIARLCSVSNEGATTTHTYTPNGLIATEAKIVLNTTYTTEYEYDRTGNQTLITYPDNSEVKYTYNKANRLEKVEQRESGGTFTDIVKDYDYGPHGMVTYQKNGNDSETIKTYDEDELYRLRSIVTNATSTYGTGGPGLELMNIESELFNSDSNQEPYSLDEQGDQDMNIVLDSDIATEVPVVNDVRAHEAQKLIISTTTNDKVEETETFDVSGSVPPEVTVIVDAMEMATTTKAPFELVDDIQVSSSPALPSDASLKVQKIEERIAYVTSFKAGNKTFEDNGSVYVLEQGRVKDKDQEVTVEVIKDRPEIVLKKWNEEMSFSVRYDDISNDVAEVKNGNLVRWKGEDGTKEVHAYSLPASEEMADGGFEIEVVLTEKPDSNVFVFPLKGYENLDFFYQPRLNEEIFSESDGVLCDDNECIGQGGSMFIERPENIIGSYAVYHKEKKDHVLGDINYGTGKVLHIYRPKVVDADGKEIWAELMYVEGQLSVTVPDEFLENASYPVVVDPTFGYTGTGGSATGYAYSADSYPYKHIGIKRTLQEDSVIQSVTAFIRQYSGHSTRPELRYSILNTANALMSGAYVYNTVERATVIGEVPSTAWAFNELEVISTSTLPAGDYHLVAGVENGGYLITFDTTANQTLSYVSYSGGYVPESSNMALVKDSSTSRTYSIFATYGTSTPLMPDTEVESFECMTAGSTDMSCTSIWKQATLTSDDGDWQAGTGTTPTTGTGPNGASHGNTYLYVEASSGGHCDGTIPEECAIEADIWEGVDAAVTFDYHILGDDTGELYLEVFDGTNWTEMFSSGYAPDWSTAGISWSGFNTNSKLRFVVRNQTGPAADIAIDNIRISTSTPSGQNFAPGEPIRLKVEGQLNPVNVATLNPTFSARAVDPDLWDLFSAYQIHVSTSSDFTGLVWDSTKTAISPSAGGWFIPDVTYSGDSLSASTTYYWKIRFWDDDDAQGLWSTDISTFSVVEPPVVPIFRENAQNLTYVYDSVGNITQITDASDTDTAATIEYEYDDLYRLTSASTIVASTTPYTRSYTYGSMGNILTKSDVGSYTYGETNYANPHAATAIAGVTYSYDANGNLVSTTDGDVYTWNYRNQLVESETASATTTYAYDHTGSRVLKSTGSATTTYPSSLYETTGTSTKKHIYANNTLVATIDSDTPAPQTYYVYSNHLGSTNVVLGEDGYINQLLDYYPYGDTRIENQYDTHNQTNRYTGHEFDEETELSYMGSRYQDGSLGKFTSQDKANLDLGMTGWEEKYDRPVELFLRDPQQLNTYSYSRNNPIINTDPSGDILPLVLAAAYAGLTIYDTYTTAQIVTDTNASLGQKVFAVGLFASPLGELKAAGAITKEGAEWLNRGKKEYGVYTGKIDGEDVYVGKTNNFDRRASDHGDRFDSLTPQTDLNYTNNQARAIEQARIVDNPQFQNKINSISPNRSFYNDVLNWARNELNRLLK